MIFGYAGVLSSLSHVEFLESYGKRLAEAAGSVKTSAPLQRGEWVARASGPSVAADSSRCVVLAGAPRHDAVAASADRATAASAVLSDYQSMGDRSIERLSGPFAIAIIDCARERVLLAIDRMGIESLAYSLQGTAFIFSTSVLSITNAPEVVSTTRPQAIYDYLLHHVVPGPATFFQGVSKLGPAGSVVFEGGTLVRRTYWSPDFVESTAATSTALATELRARLRGAVRACAPSSSTGAFLSGGLDSSTVSGLLSETTGGRAKTFSIGFGYPDYDELPYARIINSHFNCEGHEYVVGAPEIVDAFPRIARAYDEPFGNSSALPVYYCAILARENGVDHLLAGDGGDELFAGNSRYAEQRVFEYYARLPTILRKAVLEPLVTHWPPALSNVLSRKAKGYIEKATIPLPIRLEVWNFVTRTGVQALLHDDIRREISPEVSYEDMERVWNSCPSKNYLHRMLQYDWHYTLAYNDLRKVESMSRLAGVRVSYPMLDDELVRFSTLIPPDTMMRGGHLRDFYKRALSEFLPAETIGKKKHGFGLPVGLWIQESALVREMMLDSLVRMRSRRIIRGEFLDRLLNLQNAEDARYYGVFVWVIAMLDQWLHEHGVSL